MMCLCRFVFVCVVRAARPRQRQRADHIASHPASQDKEMTESEKAEEEKRTAEAAEAAKPTLFLYFLCRSFPLVHLSFPSPAFLLAQISSAACPLTHYSQSASRPRSQQVDQCQRSVRGASGELASQPANQTARVIFPVVSVSPSLSFSFPQPTV
jgi:hypothetical protein